MINESITSMIQRLCPDGVEYKPIKDVYTRLKGTPITASKMKEIADDSGDVIVVAGGKNIIRAKRSDLPHGNIIEVPSVLVQSRGIIDVVYSEEPFTFKNEMWAYTSDDRDSVKYLYYIMKKNIQTFRDEASGMGSLPQISLKVTEDYIIPYPPIEIQREIVRILDTFTSLTAELTAELSLRKKQYEFYRDKLLSFDRLTPEERERAGVILMSISEFCSISRGKGLKKKDFTSEGIGCIHYGQIYTTYNTFTTETVSFVSKECAASSKTVHPGDLIVAITSENEEDVCKAISWEGTTDIVTGGHTAILSHKQNPRFISYLFQTANFFKQKRKLVHGTKVIEMTPSDLGKIIVPIPPIETQDRIVHILDKMESLCFNLSNGIPAEIEARKKQYEYYRDRLLSFDKVSS